MGKAYSLIHHVNTSGGHKVDIGGKGTTVKQHIGPFVQVF